MLLLGTQFKSCGPIVVCPLWRVAQKATLRWSSAGLNSIEFSFLQQSENSAKWVARLAKTMLAVYLPCDTVHRTLRFLPDRRKKSNHNSQVNVAVRNTDRMNGNSLVLTENPLFICWYLSNLKKSVMEAWLFFFAHWRAPHIRQLQQLSDVCGGTSAPTWRVS